VCFLFSSIATMEDIYQNDQLFCDCPSEAKDYGTQIRYSGKYCEGALEEAFSLCALLLLIDVIYFIIF